MSPAPLSEAERRMKGGTLFSGIGAPECAMPDIDWRWCAEVDGFASVVHRARFPGVPNLGDVTKVDWDAVEPVDLVVGGPPCQGFSVAGQRGGLADPRGNLSLAYVAAIDAVDPLWCLTENVPGWLSMADNSFGHFLGRLVGADAPLVPDCGQRWTDAGLVAGPRRTAAWRVLDAQFFGVPQRRRRVFVLAVRGTGIRAWACAEALFPVGQSLRRNFAPRREAGQGVADPITRSFAKHHGASAGKDSLPRNHITADPVSTSENRTYTHEGKNNFRTHNLIAYGIRSDAARSGEALTPSPDAEGRARLRDPGFNVYEETAPTLDAAPHAVAFDPTARQPEWSIDRPLKTDGPLAVASGMAVRRLTPVECERLQGFPDGWTAITWRGKPADGNRYRALGNSMAVPVVRWILGRIEDMCGV